MDTIDFGPATRTLAGLVGGVRDDQLEDPTPCPDWTVADLLRHIGGLTLEFTASAELDDVYGAKYLLLDDICTLTKQRDLFGDRAEIGAWRADRQAVTDLFAILRDLIER